MDELGVEPNETLMIGDTEYDMQMATNARTYSLAVSYGVHEKERLLRHSLCTAWMPSMNWVLGCTIITLELALPINNTLTRE